MKTSQAGIDFIKGFEAFRAKPYLPTDHDRPTVGFGTTVHPSGKAVSLSDSAISEVVACEYLAHDVAPCEAAVSRLVHVPLHQGQFDALVSFIYNIGEHGFEESTLLKMLNAGNTAGAADQFLRWDRQSGKQLAGLTRRRTAERTMFLAI